MLTGPIRGRGRIVPVLLVIAFVLVRFEVAHATGVRSIGYVKAPDRRAALETAGPDATVDSMRALAAAVRTVPASVLPD